MGEQMRTLRCLFNIVAVVGLTLGIVSPVAVSVAEEEPELSALERELNLESFDHVWSTIRDTHWDPDLGGLDWQSVRDELRPKMEHNDQKI